MSSRRRFGLGLLALLCLGVLFWHGCDDVRVPQVEGQAAGAAATAITEAGLTARVVEVQTNDPRLDGCVVAVEPRQGSLVKPGSVVTIKVGKVALWMPDVTGKQVGEAVRELEGKGLKTASVADTQKRVDPEDIGLVTRTLPPAGAPLVMGQRVTVFYYPSTTAAQAGATGVLLLAAAALGVAGLGLGVFLMIRRRRPERMVAAAADLRVPAEPLPQAPAKLPVIAKQVARHEAALDRIQQDLDKMARRQDEAIDGLQRRVRQLERERGAEQVDGRSMPDVYNGVLAGQTAPARFSRLYRPRQVSVVRRESRIMLQDGKGVLWMVLDGGQWLAVPSFGVSRFDEAELAAVFDMEHAAAAAEPEQFVKRLERSAVCVPTDDGWELKERGRIVV